MPFRAALALLVCLALPTAAHAQNWGRVAGSVLDAEGGPIPGATVAVHRAAFGTAAGADGRFSLALPAGRYALEYRAVGFEARIDSATVRRDAVTAVVVRLRAAVTELGPAEIEGRALPPSEAGAYTLDPEALRALPTPLQDGLRALKLMPGVAGSNELSYQYSVRGGGFGENLVYLNGFEVQMPFRPRQGEQEGLSLVNPDLLESAVFYTGGFPARLGGKLSSALEARYRAPEARAVQGGAYVSLLDAGAHAAAGGRLAWAVGARRAQAGRFFATQELKGRYHPDFADVQAAARWQAGRTLAVEGLGAWVRHRFALDPSSRKTYFGTVSLAGAASNLQSLWLSYDGASRERDGFRTRLAGGRLVWTPGPRLRAEHDAAYYGTQEDETYRLEGAGVLYQVDPQTGAPASGDGHTPLGASRQSERADNRVAVDLLTARGRWLLMPAPRHVAEAGWELRRVHFADRLDEQRRASGRSAEGAPVEVLIDSLVGAASLGAFQAAAHAQHTADLLPAADRLVVTAGLRADYFSFTGERTLSPRLSARLRAGAHTVLLASAGAYHQAPSYRELRGQPRAGGDLAAGLNRGLRSQRALQAGLGAEALLPRKGLAVRAEAYYKKLDRLISYDIENVRIRYSGRNDAQGYAYGLDTQVRGEFVPGLESRVNYSFLVARERFYPAYAALHAQGSLPRPTDQRHTLSVFFQDYIPGDPSWRLHLQGLFGSGLPYTPPIAGAQLGSVTLQAPGPRSSARFTHYMRFDMGLSKTVAAFERRGGKAVQLQATAELLNVFDMVNTVAYTWTPGSGGQWARIPTRLTPRTLNARLRVEF